MGMIPTTMVASVARRLDRLDPAGQVQALDELVAAQPTPAGFVVALSRMGLPMPELDHVLHVLMVIAECFLRAFPKPLPRITEEMLEVAARKISAMGKLLQDDADEAERITKQSSCEFGSPAQCRGESLVCVPAGRRSGPLAGAGQAGGEAGQISCYLKAIQ